jgi:hypothetical protein
MLIFFSRNAGYALCKQTQIKIHGILYKLSVCLYSIIATGHFVFFNKKYFYCRLFHQFVDGADTGQSDERFDFMISIIINS